MRKTKVPRTRERWETEFSSGKWDFLQKKEEQTRLKVVCAMVLKAVQDKEPFVLFDLGSGEGLLAKHMDGLSSADAFSRYVAVDIAQAALDRIAFDKTETQTLRASLAELSDEQIGSACAHLDRGVRPVIVANEVLTYDADSVEQLERIARSIARYFDAAPLVIVSCVGPHAEKPNWTAASEKLWRELAGLKWPEMDRRVVRDDNSAIFWDLVAYQFI